MWHHNQIKLLDDEFLYRNYHSPRSECFPPLFASSHRLCHLGFEVVGSVALLGPVGVLALSGPGSPIGFPKVAWVVVVAASEIAAPEEVEEVGNLALIVMGFHN